MPDDDLPPDVNDPVRRNRFIGSTDDMRVIGVWDAATDTIIPYTPEEQKEIARRHRESLKLKARQERNR